MRFGIGALAWLAPIPWLHALRVQPGLRMRFSLLGVSVLTWSLVTLKTISAPLPAVMSLAYGLPLGLVLALPYFGWD